MEIIDTAANLPIPEQGRLDRIYDIPRDVITELGLVALARTDNEAERHRELYQRLPTQLSREEVEHLGGRVNTLVELLSPSRSGFSHGRRFELQATLWLGVKAMVNNDKATFSSAREHLRSYGGLKGKFMAWFLAREQRRL